jgi:amino acid transporter
MFFLPNLDWTQQTIVKVLYVAFLIVTNVVGVKAAGRLNDALTFIKLAPLVLFSGIGLLYILSNPLAVASNLTPFAPYGFTNAGAALILIFWAYAGFEISSIPAGEIEHPRKTLPKAIVIGMLIVTAFYLVVNVVLFGVRPWSQLAADTTPLASATGVLLSASPALSLIGGSIVGIGALISVAGADESGMIGTSRLGYALAVDGLFPRIFAEVHPRYKTPYLGIVIQAVTALVASMVADLSTLIATSVFFLAMTYVATSLSIFPLRRNNKNPESSLRGGSLIALLGTISSLYLITQCSLVQITTGLVLIAVGIPMYIWYSPKKEMDELRDVFLSRDSILQRTYREEERFLAHMLRHVKRLYRRIVGKENPWIVAE